ncbi:MAG TPA: hypothetical protein VGK67_14295 [Myxococcales bacterium]|jgi:hypothetical protein
MTLTDINQLGADVKKIADHAKATGPKSPEGKLRSSINAVKHGLAGKNLLLPGEDAAEYEARMDGVFASLAPEDEAQAQLVALVADDLWKLDRLARIEKGITLGRIEELLGLTQTAAQAGRTANALVSLGMALRSWAAQPIPTERGTEFNRRLRAMSDALDLVGGLVTDIPADSIEKCSELVIKLFGKKDEKTVPMDVYAEMYQAAGKVMSALMERGDRDEAAQQELRKAISEISLPDEAELKKLARYRKLLEDGLLRRLQALDQLRKMKVDQTSVDAADRAHEFRVKLRVVS